MLPKWFRVWANPLWALGLGVVEGLYCPAHWLMAYRYPRVPHCWSDYRLPEALGAFAHVSIPIQRLPRSTGLTGASPALHLGLWNGRESVSGTRGRFTLTSPRGLIGIGSPDTL